MPSGDRGEHIILLYQYLPIIIVKFTQEFKIISYNNYHDLV